MREFPWAYETDSFILDKLHKYLVSGCASFSGRLIHLTSAGLQPLGELLICAYFFLLCLSI